MKTELMLVDPGSPEANKIHIITGILEKGGIVGIPTETVFGLACNGSDSQAVDRLYAIKQRPPQKPCVIQVADINQLSSYGAKTTPAIERVLDRFWPGPLTVILDTKTGKTGFRMPDHKIMLAVLTEAKFPIFVTSANISGQQDYIYASDVKKNFDGLIDIVVEDNKRAQGIASTVLDCTLEPFRILRSGAIEDKLKTFLGFL
jgi:L-threonylcarbamoyladenylate synthase